MTAAAQARSLELVLDGLGFGEGPRWHADRLWFSDFVLQHVVSVGADTQPRVELEIDDWPSGLGWLPDGRLLVVSMHHRAVLRREHDGSVVIHADLSGIATGNTNDMVVAADGTTLIVGETLAAQYRAFPIGEDGSLGASRIWAEGPGRSPDGCVLDADGAIWFADASRGEVARVQEGGNISDVIATPDHAYACTLGGADGRQLFVLTCPTPPMPGIVAGTGRLWTVAVDVAHAGRP
jgi:sugar lactone lactonase YvrE